MLLNMTYKKLFTMELRPIYLSIQDLKLKKISKQRSVVRDIHMCFLHVNNVVILFLLFPFVRNQNCLKSLLKNGEQEK